MSRLKLNGGRSRRVRASNASVPRRTGRFRVCGGIWRDFRRNLWRDSVLTRLYTRNCAI